MRTCDAVSVLFTILSYTAIDDEVQSRIYKWPLATCRFVTAIKTFFSTPGLHMNPNPTMSRTSPPPATTTTHCNINRDYTRFYDGNTCISLTILPQSSTRSIYMPSLSDKPSPISSSTLQRQWTASDVRSPHVLGPRGTSKSPGASLTFGIGRHLPFQKRESVKSAVYPIFLSFFQGDADSKEC